MKVIPICNDQFDNIWQITVIKIFDLISIQIHSSQAQGWRFEEKIAIASPSIVEIEIESNFATFRWYHWHQSNESIDHIQTGTWFGCWIHCI